MPVLRGLFEPAAGNAHRPPVCQVRVQGLPPWRARNVAGRERRGGQAERRSSTMGPTGPGGGHDLGDPGLDLSRRLAKVNFA